MSAFIRCLSQQKHGVLLATLPTERIPKRQEAPETSQPSQPDTEKVFSTKVSVFLLLKMNSQDLNGPNLHLDDHFHFEAFVHEWTRAGEV